MGEQRALHRLTHILAHGAPRARARRTGPRGYGDAEVCLRADKGIIRPRIRRNTTDALGAVTYGQESGHRRR